MSRQVAQLRACQVFVYFLLPETNGVRLEAVTTQRPQAEASQARSEGRTTHWSSVQSILMSAAVSLSECVWAVRQKSEAT